jgi:hypothetical protein
MKTHITVSIAILALFSGCARSVTTAPYVLNKRNSGVVYALPKTRLRVTVTYTVIAKTKIENGIASPLPKEIVIAKPVVIEPLLVSDTKNTFVLSGERLVKDSRLDASFKFQLNDNQTLASVTSESLDKSPEIFQGLVGSGISIAKMVAVAGAGGIPTPLKEIGARIKVIDNEVAALATGNDTDKATKIKKLLDEESVLMDAAKRYLELNGEKSEEKDIAYIQILDVADFSKVGNSYTKEVAVPAAKLGDFNQPAIPVLKIELLLTDDQMARAKANFFSDDKAKPDPSIVYRVPTPVRVKATAAPKNVVVFEDDILFAQIGPFNSVEAKYKLWAKRKTAITFSATTGSVKEYGVESTSSAEAAAKALDTSLTKVQGAVVDIQKAQAAAEAAKKTPEQTKIIELDTQKKLLEAEAALIKAQQELDKLKPGSGSK